MKNIITIILAILPFVTFSQNIDSLEQVLESEIADTSKIGAMRNLAWYYSHRDSDRAIDITEQAFDIIKENVQKDSFNWYYFTYIYGVIYKNMSEHQKSLGYLKEYIDYEEKTKDSISVANAQYQIGVVNYNAGNYGTSLEYHIKALAFFTEKGMKYDMGYTLGAMGTVHRKMNNNEKAKEKYSEALIYYKAVNHKGGMADIYNNMGNILSEEKKYDEALENYLKQIVIDEEDGYIPGLGIGYENIGTMYVKKKEYTKAEEYYRKCLDIREKQKNLRLLSKIYTLYGMLQTDIKDYSSAKPMLDKGLDIAEKNNLLPEKYEVYRALSKYHERKGNINVAMDYFKKFKITGDSIYNRDVANKYSELETKYETTKKENEILALNIDNEKMDIRNFWLGLGLLISLILAGIIFYFLRQRQKTNLLLEEKNEIISAALAEKNILLKEIHHRVKNNLQVISSLLNLQSQYIEDSKAVEAINEGRSRVHAMALIHQDLYQKNNITSIDTKIYFEKLLKDLFHNYKVDHDEVRLSMDITPINLDVDTMIPLGLMLNELVSNSLKYAFEGKGNGILHISLKEENETLILQVKDNGIGMPEDSRGQESNSFGYQLIEAFVAKMKGEVSIESKEGTTVTLFIKEYQIS